MNLAKDFCDCIVSWEVQENRKISNVIYCSYAYLKSDKTATSETSGVNPIKNVSSQDDHEMEMSPILLMPFLHPELTKVSFCDLKLFISPKLGIKFDRLVIISTAKIAEFIDRSGELLTTVKGEKIIRKSEMKVKDDLVDKSISTASLRTMINQKIPSRWFRKEYIPNIDTFEILIRFSEYLVPNQLLIKYIGVKVVPFTWSPDLGSFSLTGSAILSSQGSVMTSASAGISSQTLGNTLAPNTGSNASISSSTVISVNCDRIVEAIHCLHTSLQLLSTEINYGAKGSNPHLPTSQCLDVGSANSSSKQRPRSNSPMATSGLSIPNNTNTTSTITPTTSVLSTTNNPPSLTAASTPIPISCSNSSQMSPNVANDFINLQVWLENRLSIMESNTTKVLEQLSQRLGSLENMVVVNSNNTKLQTNCVMENINKSNDQMTSLNNDIASSSPVTGTSTITSLSNIDTTGTAAAAAAGSGTINNSVISKNDINISSNSTNNKSQ